MKPKRALLLLVATFLLAQAGAQDVSLDKKLGAENAVLVEQEMGIYHHDSLYRLVNAVGKKLVSRLKNNQFEFQFFLVDSPVPNAFALPGGYIYVTRGILPIINTEDELAGVMAHEIIHVMQRHSVKQMKKSVFTSILKVPGNLLNAVTGTHIGNILNAPIDLTTSAFISKYSRGHESQADEFGIQLAASAGYKTDALADALERLSKNIALLTGEAEQKSYFSDHPYTPSRVTKVRSSAAIYKPVNPSPVTRSAKDFLGKFNGLCYGLNPEQGMFKDSLFIHADMGFTWLTPPQWQTVNKPTIVAAYPEKGDAIVAMRFIDEKKSIHEIGEEIKNKAKSQEGITIEQAGDTTINSFPAYLIRLKSQDKDQAMICEFVVLKFKNRVVQVIGIGSPTLKKEIHQSVCGFRLANREETQSLKLFELEIATAKGNETIEKLTERMGNKLNPAMTAVINNKTDKVQFKEGEQVKIVKITPYQPKQ